MPHFDLGASFAASILAYYEEKKSTKQKNRIRGMKDYARTQHELGERMASMEDAQGVGTCLARATRRFPTAKKLPMKRKLDTSPTQKKNKRLQKRK